MTFEPLRTLSDTPWSTVYLGTLNGEFAVKKVSCPVILAREVCALGVLTSSHPGIVQMLSFDAESVLLEYVPGITLRDFQEEAGKVSEIWARVLFISLLTALHWCHSHGWGHHDLSDRNVMMVSAGQVKLLDFGFATQLDPFSPHAKTCSLQQSTPEFAAPELYAERKHADVPLDMWASGILLYKLLHGRHPFETRYGVEYLLTELVHQPLTYCADLTPECRHLLDCLLDKNPYLRLTCAEVIEHPWLGIV